MKSRFLSLFLLLATIVLTGQGCFTSDAEIAASQPVTLTIWRVFDSNNTFRDIMDNYRALHPNVSFEYRQLRIEDYEDELLRAFAEGRGPDIFSIHNTWVGEYEPLITAMPRVVSIPFTETKGTVKRETVTTLRQIPMPNQRQIRSEFVDVVAQDAIVFLQPDPRSEGADQVIGLPMAVDTLALFYNRDLLNAAGIALPPSSWSDFQEAVGSLTQIGPNDTILQSGAALGTSRNVDRAFDILTLLMMQNGTQMSNARGQATFAGELEDNTLPGADAVRFYTDFANPTKSVYSWDADQPSSFDSFTSGQTAFFFGYSYHIPLIRARGEKLNFGIAPVPQITGGRSVNAANYWLESVARTSDDQNWAWDFIRFATSDDQVTNYLDAAIKPPAKRALINDYIEDEDLNAFAQQLLTAQSWYRGDDASVTEEAFLDMIDEALEGAKELDDIVNDAQRKVNQTI